MFYLIVHCLWHWHSAYSTTSKPALQWCSTSTTEVLYNSTVVIDGVITGKNFLPQPGFPTVLPAVVVLIISSAVQCRLGSCNCHCSTATAVPLGASGTASGTASGSAGTAGCTAVADLLLLCTQYSNVAITSSEMHSTVVECDYIRCHWQPLVILLF